MKTRVARGDSCSTQDKTRQDKARQDKTDKHETQRFNLNEKQKYGTGGPGGWDGRQNTHKQDRGRTGSDCR
jgi:hypothetical protein